MPRALPPAIRRAILKRSHHNQSPSEIAQELGLQERTVRRIVTGFQEQGEAALHASYEGCGLARTAEFAGLREQLLELREQHPLWGAGRLLLELEVSQSETLELPSERTLQRWLREVYSKPAPAGRPTQEARSRASQPHQVWQVDAVEQKYFGSGKMFSWLRVVDECSGAVLKTVVFSPRTFSTSPPPSNSARIPQDFSALGLSQNNTCRQRRALGFVQRSATPTGLVDHRTGNRHALECPPSPTTKWRCRTQSRLGTPLGRTETTSHSQRIPKTSRPRRLPATGTTPSDRWSHTLRSLSRIEICRANLQLSLGTNALGLGSRASALESVCRHPACRLFGKNWPLWKSTVCRDPSQKPDGLRPIRPRRDRLGDQRHAGPSIAADPGKTDSRGGAHANGSHSRDVTQNGQTLCHQYFSARPSDFLRTCS